MWKKVLCGTMAVGLAAILSLPELALASSQQSRPTIVKHSQLELVKKKRSKKGKRMRRRMQRHTQFQQPQVQQQYHV